MPWYKTGTVAITAGQTTVTGTGTGFALNARVGDAFQGPDGRWYEVTNIASATVLSILPAYQGATVSGGAYGLAPMQGYVKESADRLRQLVDQFGATLSLFGGATTVESLLQNISAATRGANSDITSLSGLTTALSIAQGGTGSKTAAGAVAALGLTIPNVGAAVTEDFNGLATPGWQPRLYATAGANSPGNAVAAVSYWYVFNVMYSLTNILQFAFPYGTASQAGRMAFRSRYQGTWGPWQFNLSFADVVGTVSSVAGQGAIIERGGNANGEYTRYADGTQECWLAASVTDQACDSVSGALFYGVRSWTFPVPFISTPVVSMEGRVGTGIGWCGIAGTPSTTSASARFLDNVSRAVGQNTALQFFAKGRWY